MAFKNTIVSDDPIQQTSLDSQELHFSPQDIATEEISSIIDAVPKESLQSTNENFQTHYHK